MTPSAEEFDAAPSVEELDAAPVAPPSPADFDAAPSVEEFDAAPAEAPSRPARTLLSPGEADQLDPDGLVPRAAPPPMLRVPEMPQVEERRALIAATLAQVARGESDDAVVLGLSKRFNLLPDTIRKGLPDFKQAAWEARFDVRRFEKQYPELVDWAAANPEALQVAVENKELSALSKAAQVLSGVGKMTEEAVMGPLRRAQAGAGFDEARAASDEASRRAVQDAFAFEPVKRTVQQGEGAAQASAEKSSLGWLVGAVPGPLKGAVVRAAEAQRMTETGLVAFDAAMKALSTPAGDSREAFGEQLLRLQERSLRETPAALPDSWRSPFLEDVGSGAGSSFEFFKYSLPAGAAASLAVSAVASPAAGATAGLVAGGAAGFGASMVMQMGETMPDMLEVRTEAGTQLTPREAAAGALLVAAAQSGLEVLGEAKMVAPLLRAAGLKKAVAGALATSPSFRSRAVEAMQAILAEGGTEGMQEFLGQLGKGAAKLQLGALLEEALREGNLRDVTEAASAGMAGAAGPVILGHGPALFGAVGKAERLLRSSALTNATSVQSADPGAVADLIRRQKAKTGRQDVETLEVLPEPVLEHFRTESDGATAAAIDEAFGPGTAQKVMDAAAAGGRVSLPLEGALEAFGRDQELAAAMVDAVALPGELTGLEAQDPAETKKAEEVAQAAADEYLALVRAEEQAAAAVAAPPAAPAAPAKQDFAAVAASSIQDAAALVTQAAAKATRFGDDAAYIASVYEQLDLGEGYSLDEFKALLWSMHKAGALELKQADLVEAMDPDLLARSAIEGPMRTSWQFIRLRDKSLLGDTQQEASKPPAVAPVTPMEAVERETQRIVQESVATGVAAAPEAALLFQATVHALLRRGVNPSYLAKRLRELTVRSGDKKFIADEVLSIDPNWLASGNPLPRGFYSATPRALKAAGRFQQLVVDEKATPNTLAHEMSHFWLAELRELAALPDAPADVVADYEAAVSLLRTPGKEMTAAEWAEVQERWAKSFEAYLLRGEAPSETLRDAFSRFREWLLAVYSALFTSPRSVSRNRLNPELASIFDRLLAVRAETEQYLRDRAQPLPDTMEATGMDEKFLHPSEATVGDTEGEARFAQSAKEAVRRIELRQQRERLRLMEEDWRTRLAALVDALRKDYDELPQVVAKRALEGLAPEVGAKSPMRLDAAAVRRVLADRKQPLWLRTSNRGMSLDAFALQMRRAGWQGTGEELVDAMVRMPSREEWAHAEGRRQLRQYLGPSADEMVKLRKDVEDGLGKVVERRIIDGFKYLMGKAFPGQPSGTGVPAQLRLRAAEMAQRMRLRGNHLSAILAAERKAAYAAQRFAAEGKWVLALGAKQQELLNTYLYREVRDMEAIRRKLDKLVAREAKQKTQAERNLGQPQLANGIKAILGQGPASDLALAILAMEDDGVAVGDWAPGIFDVLTKPDKEWTFAEGQMVLDALTQLSNLAKLANKVRLAEEERSVDEMASGLAASIRARIAERPRASEAVAQGFIESRKRALRKGNADLLNVLDYIREAVGDDVASPEFQAVIQRLQDSEFQERAINESLAKKVMKAFDSPLGSRAMEYVDFEKLSGSSQHTREVPPPSTRAQLYMLAAYAGDPQALERVAVGRGMTGEQVFRLLNDLDAKEIAFVNALVEAVGDLKQPAFDVQERVSGLRPKGVKGLPVKLKNGTLKGGYFPLAPVPNTSGTVSDVQTSTSLKGMWSDFVAPGTTPGSLKERSEGKPVYVVSLDPGVALHHMVKTAHFIAFRESTRDVAKVLMHPEVQSALRDTLGQEYAAKTLPYLMRVAQGSSLGPAIPAAENLNAMARWAKSVVTVNAMSYAAAIALGDWANLSTAWVNEGKMSRALALQARTYAASAQYLGAEVAGLAKLGLRKAGLLTAYRDVLGNYNEMYRDGLERSARLRFMDRNLVERFNARVRGMSGGHKSKGWRVLGAAYDFLLHNAFVMQQYISRATATSIWMAAERQKRAEGMGEMEAALWADDALVKLFPQHSVVNDADILQDKSYIGTATMMYGYMSTAHRIQWRLLAPLRSVEYAEAGFIGRRFREAAVLGRVLGFYTFAHAFAELLMGRGPDEDEDAWEWYLRRMVVAPVSQIPLFGSVADNVARNLQRYAKGESELSFRVNPRADPLLDYVFRIGSAVQKAASSDSTEFEAAHATMQAALMAAGLAVPGWLQASKTWSAISAGDAEPYEYITGRRSEGKIALTR